MKRYENLKVGEALSKNNLYPFACNELSSVLSLAYSRLPKDVKALIFRDTLSAFRLLPHSILRVNRIEKINKVGNFFKLTMKQSVNTSAAVSAANLLLKSVEAVLPKQKKNLAIVEFKQAKVALKRRSKSPEEDIYIPSLPQDILIHIFSFLDVSSLLSSAQVSRSWNQATHDDSLWQSLFEVHFYHKRVIRIQSSIDWREAFKKAYIAANSLKALRSGRGYCNYCNSIVWHDNLRCPNKQCLLKSGNETVDLISTHQVVNYLLGVASSSDESESDDEAVPGLWSYPTLH
ncbi:PREDICTED: F-box protein At5g52880-like isoform X1 [Camelina sativa]|uniref:F-box protein At5g52880-like isoform X1 n=1 Tax=Camelina sativa TaxID=90675 RepID=A0ABM0US28_CAMSA|nr:PREDICTED: F-box protein At5g52880-like isoform X1 [Camelina sativa]